MSIRPGDLKIKDPQSVISADFNWDPALNAGVQITDQSIVVTGPDSELVVDALTVVNNNRQVNYRLTGGTLGRRYRVTCRITTNESTQQTYERSILVQMQNL